jgi:hypothetical protein
MEMLLATARFLARFRLTQFGPRLLGASARPMLALAKGFLAGYLIGPANFALDGLP